MPKRKNNFEKDLYLLAKLQYFTLNNLYSRKAKTPKGSFNKPRALIKDLLEKGFISPIRMNGNITSPLREQFYYCTQKTYNYFNIPTDYRYKESKSRFYGQHESLKIDIALSFLLGYRDWVINIEYDKIINHRKPDIFITMTDHDKTYYYFIEIERKEDPNRTYRDKLKTLDRELTSKLFAEKGYPFTKFLVVYSNLEFDTTFRPFEYEKVPDKLIKVKKDFNQLLKNGSKVSNRFYFLPIYKFDQLHKAEWFNTTGHKINLIQ